MKGTYGNKTAIVTIPISGTYYLKLSGTSWPKEYQFNAVLSINNKLLMNVIKKIETIRSNFMNIRYRAIITRLEAGDKLVVSIPRDAFIENNGGKYLMFAGFLIQTDIAKYTFDYKGQLNLTNAQYIIYRST